MIKYRKLIVLLLVLLAVHIEPALCAADTIPALAQIKTEPITVGYTFRLHSHILNEDRLVYVCLPDDYAAGKNSYPVLYLVDGQWNTIHSAQAVGMLSGNDCMPRMIVIGVYTNDYRDRDLLPVRDEQTHTGGGANELLGFIKQELIPFVDKNYRTFPYRLLAGTSYGGVFVMHAFVTEPQLFDGYLSMSPSMWWNNGLLLKRTEDFLRENPGLVKSLYITVANE